MNTHQSWTSAAARRIISAAGGHCTVEEAVVQVVGVLRQDAEGDPVSLEKVAEQLGIISIESDDIAVSGELRRDGDSLRIAYASGLSTPRRRFTIAHELGHAFFERSGPGCPRRGKELERICDLFA